MTPFAAIWTPKKVVAAGTAISNAGGLYFSASCAVTNFDATAFTQQMLDENNGIGEIMEALEEPLGEAILQMQDRDPDAFKANVAGKDALTLFFFGKKNDGVFLSHIAFKAKRRGKEIALEARLTSYPSKDTGIHSLARIAAGVSSAEEKSFAHTPEQQALVYPKDALKKFMAAIAASGRTVYPFKIIELGVSNASEDKVEG